MLPCKSPALFIYPGGFLLLCVNPPEVTALRQLLSDETFGGGSSVLTCDFGDCVAKLNSLLDLF